MKFKPFLIINKLIIINIFQISLSQISSLIPLYKIFLSSNITHLEIERNYNVNIESKGVALVFDNSSDISLVPMHIFYQIYNFYAGTYDDIRSNINILPTGYKEFYLISNLYKYESIHFILKDFGISLPLNEFFLTKNETKHEYILRFLTKESQENIIFGKDLIKIMNISFIKDSNNFVINNKDYILTINED